jgi:RNA-directed DNA polymerase
MSNLSKLAWNEVDWKTLESRVFRIQRRIYKAKTEQKIDTVYYLQKKIIHGLNGKLLSIRKACNNRDIRIIKKVILYVPQKKIILGYVLKLQKHTFNDKSLSNSKKVLSLFETKKYEIKNEATEFLIKLALEPEWSRFFEINSMGHNLGHSYQDTIENIFSGLKIEYVFHKKVFQNNNVFDKKRFLKKLNTIKIIEIQISRFLDLKLLQFRKKEAFFYNDFIFENKQNSVLTPLLCNIALTGLENYLNGFIQYYKSNLKSDIKYFRYLDEILLITKDFAIITQAKLVCENYLNKMGLESVKKKIEVFKTTGGIDFLGFQLVVLKKKIFYIKKYQYLKQVKNFFYIKLDLLFKKINPLLHIS